MNLDDPALQADFKPILDAHNAFMEKHGVEASGDLLLAMCVMFISNICEVDATTGLAFIADMSEGFMRAIEAEEAENDGEVALQ